MHIDVKHYLIIAQTELRANWKPLTAVVGVAVVVAAIWGKTAVIGFGFVCFGAYVALGPSFKVMTYLDLKGFLLVTVLVGNGYLGWINPMYLSYYAGACMLAREWNFWSAHSELTTHNDVLQRDNDTFEGVSTQCTRDIAEIEKQVQTLVTTLGIAVPAKRQLDGKTSEVANKIGQIMQAIMVQLDDVCKRAQQILDNKTLQDKKREITDAQAELAKLKQQRDETNRKYQTSLDGLTQLNQLLTAALSTLQVQGQLEKKQIADLARVISGLQALK